MPLIGSIIPVEKVSPSRRDEMFCLLTRHYEFQRREDFDRDLDEKEWVIEVADRETDQLCGFSTQMMFEVQAHDRPVWALFSGDTIIDPRFWHRNPLAGVWGRLVLGIIEQNPGIELYWFLISKGYKTYRFLPTFFHEFYPRFDIATPTWAEALLDAFARHRYPMSYDPPTGLIRGDAQSCRLRAGLADITAERLHDPHVRFFLERNRHHMEGDELCCLAPLTTTNFTRAAHRVIDAVSRSLSDLNSYVRLPEIQV